MKYVDIDSNGNIKGFYDSLIHKEQIPESAFEIPEEIWKQCCDNNGKYMFDPTTKDLKEAPPPVLTPPTPLQLLVATDTSMARVAEDIVDLLTAEGHTFPQAVTDKIAERKALRAQLSA